MPAESAKKFIGLSSFEMLAMFRRGLFYAYLTIYLRHYLGLSVTATTLFATLPMLVNVLSQTFIWGRVSDRFQLRRSLIVAGESLAALGTAAVWYFHRLAGDPKWSGYVIIFGLTIVELFWSMSNISWSALISDLYSEDQRGRIQGRLSSMGGVGRIVGIWIGGWFYDGLGRQFAGWGFYHGDLFFAAAAVMLLSTLPLFLLPEGGVHSQHSPATTRQQVQPNPDTDALRIYVVFLVSMTLINFGRNSIGIVFPQYLTVGSGLNVDSRTLGYILNTQSAAVVCFGWLVGWLCRRLGADMTLLTASVLSILAMIILSLSTALPWIYAGSFLRGVADASILASAYQLASALIPPHLRAQRFAWFNATFFLSWGLPGTFIMGPLIDSLIIAGYTEPIAYRVSFGLAAVIISIGVVVLSAAFGSVRSISRQVV